MPILPWMGAISAGVDTLTNIGSTILGNRREDRLWERMNQYNSPQAQMERLKAAGLNPNLVYGNGSAVATTNALPKSQDFKGSNISQGVLNYANIKQTQLQNENLSAQNELIRAQVQTEKLKASNLDSTQMFRDTVMTDNAKLDTKIKTFLAKMRETDNLFYSTQKQQEQTSRGLTIAKQKIENSYLPQEKQTALKEAVTRIANLRANTRNTDLNSEMQKILIALRNAGVNPNDPTSTQFFSPILNDSRKLMEGLWSIWKLAVNIKP